MSSQLQNKRRNVFYDFPVDLLVQVSAALPPTSA